MDKPGNKGVKRIIRAGFYSLKGLNSAFRGEAAFRQELLLFAVMIPLAVVVGETALERFLLIASGIVVLLVELLNSAIEAVVDRFGGERHPLSAQAKDMGSAAVLLSLLLAGGCWGTILFF